MFRWIAGIVGALALIILVTLVAIGSGDPASGFFGGRKLGPEATKAQKVVDSIHDHQEAASILDTAVARPVSCGVAARDAFFTAPSSDGKSLERHNRFWFYRWPDGTIECFGTDGFHRITGERLQPLSVDQIKVIVADPATYPADTDLWKPPARVSAPSAPQPRPAAPAAPTATVPDLSEGPCCPK